MQSNRYASPALAKILTRLGLALVVIAILINLPNLTGKMVTLLAIPYADTGYIQREVDLLGAEVAALKFAAETTGMDKTVAWVSDDYEAREVYVRYWLYPRQIWLGDNLQEAAGQTAGVILVLKKCLAECTPAEITEPVTLNGYRLDRQFMVREDIVSVLTRVA